MACEHVVTLAGETDFEGFREAARNLLQQRVLPDHVVWSVADTAAPELVAVDAPPLLPTKALPEGPTQLPPEGLTQPPPRVSAEFLASCRQVVLHAERARFALLYRLLWRMQTEPSLRDDVLDPDMALARRMAHAVSHEMHKMKAFVRFRALAAPDGGEPLHVAWFEPVHHIVDAVAQFFVRRFAGMRWAILTPRRCLRWDGESLESGPGVGADQAPAPDAGEALWLTYYAHIFNPARLKLDTMQREMPRRYWHNLPEATLISTLAAQAHQRSGAMLAREPAATARRLPAMPTVIKPSTPLRTAKSADAELAQLREASAGCRECPLGALATQTVWGEGPPKAPLMLVGEQPGDQEDLQGRPFVGPAGRLLDRAVQQLGWDRSQLYVTNAVKHFKYEPRGKRRIHKTPAQREADACLHWLESEIAAVQPQALVALGATAARQLLGRPVAVTRERGQWLRERADGLPVLVTLHPSALLRAETFGGGNDEEIYVAWLKDLGQATAHLPQP